MEEDRKQLKEKYKELELFFWNNSLLLKKTDEKMKEIKNSRERIPTPPMYDISKGLLDKNKGFSILSRKPQIHHKINGSIFVYIQSEIDKCTKNQKLGSICYAKRHSFKLIKTENNKNVFDEDKFNKYEKNNINSERHQNTIEFLNDRKEKKNIHNYLMQQIEEKNKELIENLKSSKTQNVFENIGCNLVENSSPEYSLRGKYGSDENRENKLLFLNSLRNFSNFELKDYKPNYNYVKPRIQSFKFPKDERFKSDKSESNMNNSKDIPESKINNKSKNLKSNNASKSFDSDTIELNYEKEN